ncbi:MAG: aminotransferase class III-fold pyridoxal phosphate-dependent enzyme [Thioalkalispiraceae bacterium]|jgi:glutamate-1-semialdehyde 2,1-aminomutase
MEISLGLYVIYVTAALYILRKLQVRLRLSRAKHPSLRGHAKMSRRVAKLVPFYDFSEERFFSSDNAPAEIAQCRRQGFERLALSFQSKSPKSIAMSGELEESISDVLFTNTYRVPFQYQNYVREHLKLGSLVDASAGTQVRDLDGNWSYDLTGSYGVNVFGYDFYKECMEKGIERVKDLGPVLGPYHPVIVENVQKLKAVSGLDEVSFHMSGTEAVMQAVRLARYHTGNTHLVRFCGSYHGWWDGVQPGIGNDRKTNDVYTLKDMDQDSLKVLRTRKDIACVLINPLQALHPNANAPGDAMLINSERGAKYNREAYTTWLHELREVCRERKIVFIIDDVFMGFRLAYGGSQEYFNIDADMVTYGKTLGGGLPVGVVCGRHQLMKRFSNNKPTHICFARGTFNSHPYVMGAMNEFLKYLDTPEIRERYAQNDELWNSRVAELNNRLGKRNLPVRVVNMSSVWTITYTQPSRYNWMFQYYLRAEGLAISWVGSGRIIMSHNFSDNEYEEVMQAFVTAAEAMQNHGWWWQDASLTNKSIKKQLFREMMTAIFK